MNLLFTGDVTPHDAVLTWTNTGHADGAPLGEVLADHVDQGGAVVVTVFANTSPNAARSLRGRWRTGYELIQPGQDHTLGISWLGAVLDPTHPTLAGVVSLESDLGFRPVPTTTIQQADMNGEFSLRIDTARMPQGGTAVSVQPGDTRHFQACHLDLAAMGGNTSNLTDGLMKTFR